LTSVPTTPALMTLAKPNFELHFVWTDILCGHPKGCVTFSPTQRRHQTNRKTFYHRPDSHLKFHPQSCTDIVMPRQKNSWTKRS